MAQNLAQNLTECWGHSQAVKPCLIQWIQSSAVSSSPCFEALKSSSLLLSGRLLKPSPLSSASLPSASLDSLLLDNSIGVEAVALDRMTIEVVVVDVSAPPLPAPLPAPPLPRRPRPPRPVLAWSVVFFVRFARASSSRSTCSNPERSRFVDLAAFFSARVIVPFLLTEPRGLPFAFATVGSAMFNRLSSSKVWGRGDGRRLNAPTN